MLIFWEQRLVFLATPKAGSTAIAMALESLATTSIQRPASMKHTDISTFHRHVAPWLAAQTGAEFTTVALMREPVDWLRSWYRFRLRDDLDDPEHLMDGVSFERFAKLYAEEDGPQSLGIGSQAPFLQTNEHRVDRIFRYENIGGFVEFLEDRLDCAVELPRANVPPTVDVELSSEQEERLRQTMQEDLQLYAAIE
ncbi:sulfotransferase family 2 domain-containing protein [Paracoccus onubensis]|nr:sulfotransferase family 2 domain-containing protein [Paracoccus onubensis]MDP0927313.1 sulfotransferase family 2 domain-containing protein [Paracoccus onubensis]